MSFCVECGSKLPEVAKFCPECGTRVPLLAEPAPPEAAPPAPPPELPPGLRAKFEAARSQLRGDRREVTVLFADVKGYTALSERLDPEEVTLLMNALLQRLAGAVYDYEGYVDKFIGDAIMALFGAPLAHENDAERAVLAGLAMLAVVADHNLSSDTPLALRVGINLGEVVAAHLGTEMQLQYTVLGDTVNVASRLESAAKPNTVLVSEAVQQRIRDRFEEVELAPLSLKGKSEPVRAFRILRYSGEVGSPRQDWSPFAGRADELARLESYLTRLDADGPSGLIVEGEAGAGKSRLIAQALERAALAVFTVAFSQIRLPGQRAPEIELFDQLGVRGEGSLEVRARAWLGDDFEIHRRGIEGLSRELAGLADPKEHATEDPQTARQNRWIALAALLHAAAERDRLALLFEDVHWADESAGEFLAFLISGSKGRPIPILMSSRPAGESSWLPADVERLVIGPLDESSAEKLLGGRLDELAPEDRRELIRRSQGNPLFLEELVRAMEDSGEEGRHSVPGTVQGLIKSRIDRLDPPLQLLLQMASVLGIRIPTRLLARMYALETQPLAFDAALATLQERGFLQEHGPDEQGFRHALIGEVAYGGLLQRVRSVLHESAARLGEEFFADRGNLEAPFFGHHYWHAGLRQAASPHLWIAGKAAAASYDLPTAEMQLRRLADVLEEDSEALSDSVQWVQFCETFGEVLVKRGDLDEADEWFSRLNARGQAEGHPEWIARGTERRGWVAWYRGELEQADRLFQSGLEVLPEGAELLAADLHSGLGAVHHYQGHADRAFEHTSRALRLREKNDDRLGMAKCLLNIGNVHLDLREDLDSAERFYREAAQAAESLGDRQMRFLALNNLSRVAMERGEWRDALETLDRAERVLEDIGWSFARYVTLQNRADCEIALGRLGDAVRHLTICLEKGDGLLGPVNRITTRIYLVDAYMRMLEDDQAREVLEDARRVIEECATPEELHEIHLREGRLAAARGAWGEAAGLFARAEESARHHAAPTQIVLTATQRRRAEARASGRLALDREDEVLRSRPYSALVRYLDADAAAACGPTAALAQELAEVEDQAKRMGIVSLERAAAERLAEVLASLGDAAGATGALARAAQAMLRLAEGLPPGRRDAFLEHPRNAPLGPHLQPTSRAGSGP